MKLFAMGDLHLSLCQKANMNDEMTLKSHKPMDIFGEGWANHTRRIYENWQDTVGEDDLVLVPGDISWAMTLEEAVFDFDFVGDLHGKKVLLRGNHDYWWHSPTKIRKVLPPGIEVLQNEAIAVGEIAITGTRLWSLPQSPDFSENDQKVYERELIRLELSLKAAKGREAVTMFHYMPVGEDGTPNEVTELVTAYNVSDVIYGHLHDKSHRIAVEGDHFGSQFHLVSADYLNFTPKFIREI